MSLETKKNLDQQTIDKLQDLIQINIDSRDGFAEAAKQLEDVSIASAFEHFSQQRGEFAGQLQEYVSWNGERPQHDGSYAAAFHRTWIDIRNALTSNNTKAILSEAERGEDQIKEAYEEALKATAGSAMSDLLHEQYRIIKEGHDRIRDLRDAYRSS